MEAPLLSVHGLTVDFNTDAGNFRAVDGLTFDIPKGKTVALVGESGSGKSVTAQAILHFAKGHLPGFQRPRTVDFVPALPRSPAGKVLRAQVRAPYWKGRSKSI